MFKKPATERGCAQGIVFSEELSFADQKCNISVSQPFTTFCPTLGLWPPESHAFNGK